MKLALNLTFFTLLIVTIVLLGLTINSITPVECVGHLTDSGTIEYYDHYSVNIGLSISLIVSSVLTGIVGLFIVFRKG